MSNKNNQKSLKCLEIKQRTSKQYLVKEKVTMGIRKYLELNGSETWHVKMYEIQLKL